MVVWRLPSASVPKQAAYTEQQTLQMLKTHADEACHEYSVNAEQHAFDVCHAKAAWSWR